MLPLVIYFIDCVHLQLWQQPTHVEMKSDLHRPEASEPSYSSFELSSLYSDEWQLLSLRCSSVSLLLVSFCHGAQYHRTTCLISPGRVPLSGGSEEREDLQVAG